MYTRIMPFANWTDREIKQDLGIAEVSTKRNDKESAIVENFYSVADINSMQGAPCASS
jgi:hypothetical protein